MTIKQIKVEAFKCFSSLNLQLGQLSLFTGFNAAGKSTALQPLLLFAQALRAGTFATSSVALNGPLAALGTVGEIVNRGSRGVLSFSFIADEEEVSWPLAPSKDLGSGFMEVQSARFIVDDEQHTTTELCPPEGREVNVIRSIHNLIFISPLRDARTGVYPFPQPPNVIAGDVGTMGEYAPWWYVQCADDEVYPQRRHHDEERTTVRGQMDAWLRELFPGARVNADTIAKTALARLEFGTAKSSDWHRPANVGYGFAYVFPILVALLTAAPEQILIIDSPECHLHPRAQSTMGMILSYFAASGLQIIVESHSDHLLSGIRRAVKYGHIDHDQVMLHFFGGDPSLGSTDIVSPAIDSEGAVDLWPEGFFDQTEKDLSELTGWDGE